MTAKVIGNHVLRIGIKGEARLLPLPLPPHQVSNDPLEYDDFTLELSHASNGVANLGICRCSSAVRLFHEPWKVLLPILKKLSRNWVFLRCPNHETQVFIRQNASPVVADAGAATPIDPALTVPENTQGEATSPASPTTPPEAKP